MRARGAALWGVRCTYLSRSPGLDASGPLLPYWLQSLSCLPISYSHSCFAAPTWSLPSSTLQNSVRRPFIKQHGIPLCGLASEAAHQTNRKMGAAGTIWLSEAKSQRSFKAFQKSLSHVIHLGMGRIWLPHSCKTVIHFSVISPVTWDHVSYFHLWSYIFKCASFQSWWKMTHF